MSKKDRICTNCKHYYISFDKTAPYGCRLYGFISKQSPMQVIKKETGTECLGFTIKEAKKSLA